MWNSINVHKELIYKDTGKAVLIIIPKLIEEDEEWGIWVPKQYIKFDKAFADGVVFAYPPTFDFDIVKIDDNDKTKNISEAEFVTLFDEKHVDVYIINKNTQNYIDNVVKHYNRLRKVMVAIREEQKIPDYMLKELFTEEDIKYMDKIFERIFYKGGQHINILNTLRKE